MTTGENYIRKNGSLMNENYFLTWVTEKYDMKYSVSGNEMKQLKTNFYAHKQTLELLLPQDNKPKIQTKLDQFVSKNNNEPSNNNRMKRSRDHDSEDDNTRATKKAKTTNNNTNNTNKDTDNS